MNTSVIEKQVEINASPLNVWRVFTDPVITRQMGGEYVSDWKVGGSFGWKGKDGNMYTQGTILQVEPGKLLKHNLFGINDKNKLLSVITYQFIGHGNTTMLIAKEELNYETTADQLKDASEGWDAALSLVKETAEKLRYS